MADGSIGGQADAAHGEGFRDWGFEVVKIASFLLSHGAQFVYTADDAYNPSVDPRHPGLVFPLPGPGMFAAMMHKLMYPHGKSSVACAGKGGNKGGKYMMEQARRMLMEQGAALRRPYERRPDRHARARKWWGARALCEAPPDAALRLPQVASRACPRLQAMTDSADHSHSAQGTRAAPTRS